mmetsp:Transcript_103335/g.269157  ORF Transcript_103335/g.269157 Transcript_103335/m.269157 type:complete len:324 (-) Transcript_103335:188-1159(-)
MCFGRGCLFSTAITVALLAALGPLLGHLTRVEYRVHSGGCVLVTGASSGIGRSAARALLKHNFKVYAGVRKAADGDGLKQAAGALADRLNILILDVTKAAEVDSAAASIQGCGQPFVGLVNNAGVSPKRPLETVPMETFRETFEVNLFGVVDLTQRLIPLLRASGGRIVNVGSVSGSVTTSFSGTYSATKYALEAVSDGLRLELTPWNISVSMVNPAYVTTDIRLKSLAQVSQPTPVEQELYASTFATLEAKEPKLREFGSPCCDVTDDAIVHALVDPFPRTRYYPAVVAPGVQASWVIPLIKFCSMHPYLERALDMLKAKLF